MVGTKRKNAGGALAVHGQTVYRVMEEIQKTTSSHRKYLGVMWKLRAQNPKKFFDDVVEALEHVLVAEKVIIRFD